MFYVYPYNYLIHLSISTLTEQTEKSKKEKKYIHTYIYINTYIYI